MLLHETCYKMLATLSYSKENRKTLKKLFGFSNVLADRAVLDSKVEKILKSSQDLISSPSRNPFLDFFGKTLLGAVNKLFHPLHQKPTFLAIIWIITEGDGIESRLFFIKHFLLYIGDSEKMINLCISLCSILYCVTSSPRKWLMIQFFVFHLAF